MTNQVLTVDINGHNICRRCYSWEYELGFSQTGIRHSICHVTCHAFNITFPAILWSIHCCDVGNEQCSAVAQFIYVTVMWQGNYVKHLGWFPSKCWLTIQISISDQSWWHCNILPFSLNIHCVTTAQYSSRWRGSVPSMTRSTLSSSGAHLGLLLSVYQCSIPRGKSVGTRSWGKVLVEQYFSLFYLFLTWYVIA